MQVAVFCVSFALSEVFMSESLYLKKNLNRARNLPSAVQQNHGRNVAVWGKGRERGEAFKMTKMKSNSILI